MYITQERTYITSPRLLFWEVSTTALQSLPYVLRGLGGLAQRVFVQLNLPRNLRRKGRM